MARQDYRHTDEYIWEWYQHFEKAKRENLNHSQYCKEYNLKLSEARTMSWRIIFRRNNKTMYARLLQLAKEFEKSNVSMAEFCRQNALSTHQLSETFAHLRHLEVIERLSKKEIESKSEMKFIAIQPQPITLCSEPEVLPKKNDIEITISQGIKVIIAPEVPSEKLIRIIELLKDL
jgi:hypothetical protein